MVGTQLQQSEGVNYSYYNDQYYTKNIYHECEISCESSISLSRMRTLFFFMIFHLWGVRMFNLSIKYCHSLLRTRNLLAI
jgi:hypothetical protein